MDRWLGPRLELRHSDFTPCLQMPLRRYPLEALGCSAYGKKQRKTRGRGPSQSGPRCCVFAGEKLLGQHVWGPAQPYSQTRSLRWPRTESQRLLLTPTESPGKGVSWQPLGLAPAPPRGCCHVQLTLSSLSSSSQAASPQSQEITCSVMCPINPATQARPDPPQPLLSRCARLLQQKQLFLPARARSSPTSAQLRALSWQRYQTLYHCSLQPSRAWCQSKSGAKSWNTLCSSAESQMESSPGSTFFFLF